MTSPHPTTGPVAGFPLTLAATARVLNVTPDEVVDLVRAGHLGAYLATAHEVTERPPLRFHPDALPAVAAQLADPDSRASGLHVVANGLRAYFEQRTPTGTLADSVERAAPILARTRGKRVLAHVRADHLIAFLEAGLEAEPIRRRATLRETVVWALTSLGCVRVRGIRPLHERAQAWGTWWRVPDSLWSPDSGASDLGDLTVFGGAREPGERLLSDQDGTYVPGGDTPPDDSSDSGDPWPEMLRNSRDPDDPWSELPSSPDGEKR